MPGPKQRKKLKGVELARKRQPTGRLLADVLRKSKKDTKKGSPHKMDATDKIKKARKLQKKLPGKVAKYIKRGLDTMKKVKKP